MPVPGRTKQRSTMHQMNTRFLILFSLPLSLRLLLRRAPPPTSTLHPVCLRVVSNSSSGPDTDRTEDPPADCRLYIPSCIRSSIPRRDTLTITSSLLTCLCIKDMSRRWMLSQQAAVTGPRRKLPHLQSSLTRRWEECGVMLNCPAR